MCCHVFAGFFNLLPALRDAAFKWLPVILDEVRKQEQQGFLLPKLPYPFQDHFMQRAQVAGYLLITDNIL
jgi:hypothetical protein